MTQYKEHNDAIVKEIIRRWMEDEEMDVLHEYTAYYLRGVADVFDCLEGHGGDETLSRAVAFVRSQLMWTVIAFFEEFEQDPKIFTEEPERVEVRDELMRMIVALNTWEFHEFKVEDPKHVT